MPVEPSSPSPGWQARLVLGFAERAGRTVLAERSQRGPLAVQRPFYPEGAPCHVYLLHPPGGVVGGDRLEIAVSSRRRRACARHHARGRPSSTAAPDPRRGRPRRCGSAAGGILEWLPQENILFPGANARLSTQVDLDPGARFIGWEIQALGRPANGEGFATGAADLSLDMRRAGVPLLLDRLRIARGEGLDGPAGLRGFPVTATLVASRAGADDLAAVREQCAADAGVLWGATLLDDLLVVRCLAPFAEPARMLLTAVWATLRPRLLNTPVCAPRIWGT